jgi:hypothetical protein
MGSGKTTVLFEASDILASRNIPHAAVDLDALGTAHLPAGVQDKELMYRNLRSVWENYNQVGVKRFLLARAIENREELECCREAVKPKGVDICCLTARHTDNGGARSKPRGGRIAEELRGSCCGTEFGAVSSVCNIGGLGLSIGECNSNASVTRSSGPKTRSNSGPITSKPPVIRSYDPPFRPLQAGVRGSSPLRSMNPFHSQRLSGFFSRPHTRLRSNLVDLV